METMIELTVMFENQTIPPMVLLTGPFEEPPIGHTADASQAVAELREQAEEQLGAQLEDGQCFYRFFRRQA